MLKVFFFYCIVAFMSASNNVNFLNGAVMQLDTNFRYAL